MSDRKRFEGDPIADFHIHPDYSIDAKGSIDDYCRRAFDIGLSEICFTTHYDADPSRADFEGAMVVGGQRVKISDEAVRRYLDDVDRAREEYGRIGLVVRSGMEFGYFPGCDREISRLQSKFPLEYRLGAVHTVGEHCICCKGEAPKLFAKLTVTQLADRYFELLTECAATGLFDCLAHIDAYRRYGLAHYGDEINTVHRGRIEKLFATMQAHGVGYELNTSAIRHGHAEYYPAMEIVNLARAAGVSLITLGSDAHHPDQLALDFETAATVAYELFPYVDE
ncbi:MAG: histidinol-phosphatase HisJ family protein [candidate division Zixibacteria bacterium]|nr:histidinol-phosphatase HisJ family protein [candidate division Zixibacteria bacterium]